MEAATTSSRVRYAGAFAVPATLILIAGLLAGCSAQPFGSYDLVTSAVDPASTPAFLGTTQRNSDLIDDLDVTAFGVVPASLRYQGEWEGLSVYLGVSGISTVHVITGRPGDPDTWGSGSSEGNTVIGLGRTDETTLQYLPQGTSEVPEGWHALSPHVIVKS